MPSRRASALVAFVIVVAIVQIAFEDALLFLGATGADGPAFLRSPALMIVVPFGLFLLLAGVLYVWAISTDDTLR